MLRSNSGAPLFAVQCLPSCVLPGLSSETMRACDRLHLRHRSSCQVRGSIYHAYNFQLTVPSSRIERLLDPTTLYLCLHILNPNSHVPPHPSKPCIAMLLCSLLSHCLVCMLELYSNVILLLLGLGYHIIIVIIVVVNMIIIIQC